MIKFKSVAAATFLFASVAGIGLMPTPAQAKALIFPHLLSLHVGPKP